MKWLEIIELRTTESNREMLETLLMELVEDVDRATEEQAIATYSRVMPYADFGIHLFHDTPDVEHAGSQLGLHISSALKAYGMVNHSTWIQTLSK